MSGADKRVFPRFAVELAVELEETGGRTTRGTSRNLSRGGLCAETEGDVAGGTDVVVRVTLIFSDDRTSEPLELPARVVWCTSFGDSHQVGCQFRPLSAERLTYLDMFLRYLEAQRDGEAGPGDDDDPFAA